MCLNVWKQMNFFKNIINADKTLVYGYDKETKQLSPQ